MFDKDVQVEFESGNLLLKSGDGSVHAQSLEYYPRLAEATDEQRARWELSCGGIRWDELDEDVSFESFFYDDGDPLVVSMRRRKIA